VTLEIRNAHPDQLNEIAAWIARLQVQPRHHVGYMDIRPEGIAAEIVDTVGDGWPEKTILAYEGDQLVGCVVYDNPTNHHRVWINGPFSIQEDVTAWQTVADALYERAPQPAPGMEHELFVDAANENVVQFAERHGFPKLTPAAALVMKRDRWLRGRAYAPGTDSVQPFGAAWEAQLRYLHPQTFPNTYASADELIEQHGKDEHMMFIESEGESLRGYIFVQIDEAGDCYIDYLGVALEFRRMGVGRRLITKALQWGFDHPDVPLAHLTVNRNNDAAIALYVSLGFTHERTLVAYRKRFG